MEVPLFAWLVITVLAVLVWASSLSNKLVPIWLILAFAYTSTAMAAFMYMRLKWIRSQLSPAQMTKDIMHLVSAGTSDSAPVNFNEAINIGHGDSHEHKHGKHGHEKHGVHNGHGKDGHGAGHDRMAVHSPRQPLLASPRTEVLLEGTTTHSVCPTALSGVCCTLHVVGAITARSRGLSSVHSAVESKLLGKEIGMGWHEPLYLLRPPPDAKLKRQSRQYQLYPFGQHGVHLMTRVRTAQLS